MTGLQRLPILAIAALLAAGCGAGPGPTAEPSASPDLGVPSPSPLPTAIPSAAPTEVLEPSPEPAITPEPSHDTCPAAPPAGQPAVRLSGPLDRISPTVDIRRMARVSDPATALPLPVLERSASLMSFIGGRRSSVDLYYVDFSWPFGWNITSLAATLTIDGRDPRPLDVELVPDSLGNVSRVSIRFPDREATGALEVRIAWYDTCFAYDGVVSTPVRIYPESSVEGCPTGRVAAFDELATAFNPPILVNGTVADLVAFGFAGKVRDMAVIDPLPPYVGFEAETPTVGVAPGSTITIAYDNPAVELSLIDPPRAIFFEREPLLRWLDGGWIHGDEPEAPIVFRPKLVAEPDGTYTFKAPPEPGRYAAEVTFAYDAACTLGMAGFVVGVDAT